MSRTFHFISGLPRSGSTLLAALLRQNPRFHAGMMSPVGGLFSTLLSEMSQRNETSVFISDAQRARLLNGVFENYYGPEIRADVIFDTNRTWTTRLPALRRLMPASRVIACVREIHWIIDSIERLVRKNAFSPSSIFNYTAGGTVYTRANGLVSMDGMVGYAYDALKEAFYGDDADRLMLVQYDTLTREPGKVMEAIYGFIDEPYFQHDFEHVAYDGGDEFDLRAGMPGLHEVRARVAPPSRDTILPPELVSRFENDAFWKRPGSNRRGVRIV
ncbi:sulfotransferase family protein [Burkholderia guangdongensis]|uniref:sulfotransferase family protein n=1 Tax=Burkholderia guangdongensis TaxID=1792500 RepID=UPI0015CA6278|nr:sulfotransferase [Burkholderia guangdongensis]